MRLVRVALVGIAALLVGGAGVAVLAVALAATAAVAFGGEHAAFEPGP